MGRPVVLSNGQLFVGLNEQGLVHDFYYPYVGLENLTTARSLHHKIGVWVNGTFSWVDDGSWHVTVTFEENALVSSITMENQQLQVQLQLRDFVDTSSNTLIRRISINNQSAELQDVRIFMHQVFQISRTGRADTALFVPDANYLLDYKGRCALLIYGQTSSGAGFDQYAVGNYGIEGKTGTYKDAEDGELSGNAVEHGGVDSVVRFRFSIAGGSSAKLDYWIIAAASQYDCEDIHQALLQKGVEACEETVRTHWREWLAVADPDISRMDTSYQALAKKSLMIIKAHTDKRGGVLASGDSSIFNYGRDYYCYCWPRDGAYAMWPLIRLGYTEEPKKFFEFCRDTLDRDGYLMHKYQPDRAIGSTWHPLVHENRKELAIQEDETASIIAMLGEYLDESDDIEFVESLYATLVQPMANFMAKFIDPQTNLPHASYDLWEEKFLTNTYTVALTEYALRRAATFADEFGYPDDAVLWRKAADTIATGFELLYDQDRQAYRKGLYLQPDGNLRFDNTIDISSLYGVLMYSDAAKLLDKIKNTAQAVETVLANPQPTGGIARYENDNYMRKSEAVTGNTWFVCTYWLAQYYARVKQIDKAKHLLDTSLPLTYASGVMSEQIDPASNMPTGVAPLVWSHAEFINTVLDVTQ